MVAPGGVVTEEDSTERGPARPYLVLVLSWFDKCNNQDHLSFPELEWLQFRNIGLLLFSPIAFVLFSVLLSFYDCAQPTSYPLLLSLGSL